MDYAAFDCKGEKQIGSRQRRRKSLGDPLQKNDCFGMRPYAECRSMPISALTNTAAIPTGIAIFHPIFMSWS